jgi:hypothetical protein
MLEKRKKRYDATRILISATSICVLIAVIGAYAEMFDVGIAKGLVAFGVLLSIAAAVIRLMRGDFSN